MDFEPSSPAGPRVAIVGAGLTGLLAAHGLRKHGFDVALFDAEPALDARANRDWTIVLHWALPVMQALLPAAVVARLPHAICNPFLAFDARAEAFAVFHGATGDPLFQSPMPGSRRVSRQRLRRVLAEGLDVGIQWGRTVTALTDAGNSDNSNNNNNTANGPLRLTFADGSTYDADYVLGTDGANSRLRALLLDPDGTGDGDGAARARTTGSGLLFATCLVRYHDAAKVAAMTQLHPVTAACMGTDAVVAFGVLYAGAFGADQPADPADWTMFWVKLWQGTRADAAGQLTGPAAIRAIQASASTQRLCAAFRDPILWTNPGADTDANPNPDADPEAAAAAATTDATCYVDEMRYWIPVPFDHRGGRATLAGDAAHPMLVYRGQGFQHAITDADNYVRMLVQLREVAAAATATTAAAAAKDDNSDVGGLATARRTAFDAYGAEMTARGAAAVNQSVQEAALSFDPERIKTMRMVREGHKRSA